MPWWTWLALGAFALAVVAVALLAVYALGRLQRAQSVAEGLRTSVDELSRTAVDLERRLAATQRSADKLERERARLAVSFERLSVLAWALSDARKNVTRLREAYLRK